MVAVTDADDAEAQYAHLQKYDRLEGLHAKLTGGAVTVAQVIDGDLELVTLEPEDLHAIVDGQGREDGYTFELAGHPGTATRTGDVEPALIAPDFDSAVVEIEQQKFSAEHRALITVVDAAELIAEYEI